MALPRPPEVRPGMGPWSPEDLLAALDVNAVPE